MSKKYCYFYQYKVKKGVGRGEETEPRLAISTSRASGSLSHFPATRPLTFSELFCTGHLDSSPRPLRVRHLHGIRQRGGLWGERLPNMLGLLARKLAGALPTGGGRKAGADLVGHDSPLLVLVVLERFAKLLVLRPGDGQVSSRPRRERGRGAASARHDVPCPRSRASSWP